MTLTLSRSPRPGDLLDVEITDLHAHGTGFALLDALVGPQKQPLTYQVFIRKTIPGDHVRIYVEQQKRREIIGHVVEFISPSPMRIQPRCAHYGFREQPGKGCGGCTLQSLDARHQLLLKERLVKNLMSTQRIDPGLVLPAIGMDDPWYYRNKMELSFGDNAARELSLGLHPSGYKHDVLSLSECFLSSPFVSSFVPKMQEWAAAHGLEQYRSRSSEGFLRLLTIREGKRTGERLIELTTSHAELAMFDGQLTDAAEIARHFKDAALAIAADMGQPHAFSSVYWTQWFAERGSPSRQIPHHLHGNTHLHEELRLPGDHSLRFAIHPHAFFQPNTLQAEVLYATVLQYAGLLNEQPTAGTILDLYCGAGTISLCMAPYARRVIGVELNASAVESARYNAALNKLNHVEFFVGDVAKVLKQEDFASMIKDLALVIVDPPRSGLMGEAREQLKMLNASRIVYVSCNPESLARDLSALSKFGYKICAIQPIDMFPHTHHIENVVLLERVEV
jgi:23S rRNA (uracil1939-C5)-methyltransferase